MREQSKTSPEMVLLKMQDDTGRLLKIPYTMRKKDVLGKLIRIHCNRMRQNPLHLRFLCNDITLDLNSTPEELDLTNNDVIHVLPINIGA